MQQQPSIEEQHKTALSDLASLGRVSHRVALVDTTEKLQTVLEKLLPRLLQRIGDNHQQQVHARDASLKETLTQIHLKLVEMLSHVMKRVREDRSCRLNANGILSLLLTEKGDTSSQILEETTCCGTRNNIKDVTAPTIKLAANNCDAFTVNLSLAFLTLAVPRCTSIELETILPGLLVLHAAYEEKVEQDSSNESSTEMKGSSIIKQWYQISHLLLRTVEGIIHQEEIDMKQCHNGSNIDSTSNKRIKTHQNKKNEPNTTIIPGLEQSRDLLTQNPVIAAATYDLFLDVFLYETQAGNVPPAGLSTMGWDRLKSGYSSTERDWAAEMAPLSRLATIKLRLMECIAPHRRWGLFMGNRNEDNNNNTDDPQEKNIQLRLGISRTVALLVVASGDPIQRVSETAKQYLKQYFDSQRISTDNIFGLADRLCKELLCLSVGGIKAETVLGNTGARMENSVMGFFHWNVSFRRRQVSDSIYSEVVETLIKALEDTTDTDMIDIGKMSILACDKVLSKFGNAAGLNNQRGRPFMLAAEHLRYLVVRLDNCMDQNQTTHNLQGRALAVATHVLSPIAAAKVTSPSNAISESSVAARDSIYGVISVLSRSCFAEKNFLCVMAAGRMEAVTLSTDLLQLLLRCVGNEVHKLQPRAMAALDALLFACCRAARKESGNLKISSEDTNPWITSSSKQTGLTTLRTPPAFASQLARLIIPLLWMASQNQLSRQSRVAAARWASDLLVNLDLVSATHVLCFLSGDSDVTAASIAREGLGFGRVKEIEIPGFKELCIVLFPDLPSQSRPGFWDFSLKGKTIAVKCLLTSFLGDFHVEEADATLLLESLSKLLSEEGSSKDMDLMEVCSEALSTCLGASSTARNLVRTSATGLGPNTLRDLILSAGSVTTRRFLSGALSTLMMDLSNFDSQQWKEFVSESILIASDVLKVQPLKSSAQVHGAALLAGLSIKLIHADLEIDWGDSLAIVAQLMVSLSSGLLSPDDTVGTFCCDGILILCSVDSATTLHERLVPGMENLLSKLEQALIRFGNGDRSNASRVIKILEPAGQAMAFASTRAMQGISGALAACVSATVKLLGSDSFRKDEEVSLCAGEALAKYACGYRCSCDSLQQVSSEWPSEMDETFAKNLVPPAQVLFYVLRTARTTNNNHQRRACAPALLALVAKGATMDTASSLRRYLQSMVQEIQDCLLFLLVDGKSSQLSRESCCLGLVALNKLLESSGEEADLQDRLLRSFGQTTNYGGSAMQETPTQAEERRRGEGVINNTELSAATSDVEVGGVAGMSEASLGAYVEIASAAVACGLPHLVYSMLVLSASHHAWSTQTRRDMYGPSALLGATFSKDEVKVALRPYLARLLPRILRACHDPNKQTREQMETLWIGLTGGGEEGRLAISRHLRSTFDALVEESSSKLWRARVGACGALAEVIVGRSWLDLGGGGPILDENYDLIISKTASESTVAGIRLLRLWRCSLRSLDDVRVAVRESGEKLGKSVRSLTIRLCNSNQELGNDDNVSLAELERHATAAAATALRFLLKTGLKQQCAEAAGICISTLIGIIDIAAKPSIFEALLSDVINALLLALSNLEPAALSYLSVRQEAGSAEYEDLARLRLNAAQNSTIAIALRKCIDMVPLLEAHRHQEAVVCAIELAMRKSTGIATRSACADSVITLCHTTPEMFRSSSSSNSLLRCFFEGIFKERGGEAIQNKMNAAFGSLASLCNGSEVRKIALVSSERYTVSHGNSNDPASRHAAALTLRSIAVKASNHLPQQTELWSKKILPVALLGTKEPDNPDAPLWKEVWEDGGAAIVARLEDSDENTMEEKLLWYLVKECVDAIQDVSWRRRVTGAIVLGDLAVRGILSPPLLPVDEKGLPQFQRRTRRRAEASLLALSTLIHIVARNRVWSGKAEVVKATAKVAIPWLPFSDPKEAKKLMIGFDAAPVIGGASSTKFDLFCGDRWFEKPTDNRANGMGEEDDEETVQQPEEMISTDQPKSVVVTGLCRLLLLQSFPGSAALRSVTEEEVLPFQSQVLQSLEEVLRSLPDVIVDGTSMRESVLSLCGPTLFNVFGDLATKEQPLLVARTISCFAASFRVDMPFFSDGNEPYLDCKTICALLLYHADYTKQAAWTVREAAAECGARMATCADVQSLRRGQFVSDLIRVATVAQKDRKFWRVRLSSLQILQSIVLRGIGGRTVATKSDEKQLALEAVLPYKESIREIGKMSLKDTDAQVTALATKILGDLSIYP